MEKNKPYYLKTKDKDLYQKYELDGSKIYYATNVDKVYDNEYDSGSDTIINLPQIFIIHAGFEIDEEWPDGVVKEFYFRGMFDAIKINPINYRSTIINNSVGNVIFEIETPEGCFYNRMSSYLEEFTVTDPSNLRKTHASYNIKVELRKVGTTVYFDSIEYSIPYYHEDVSGTIYKQGHFVYRKISESSNTLYSIGGSIPFGTRILRVNLTIDTDWTLNQCALPCNNWADLFSESSDKMNLTIKTLFP